MKTAATSYYDIDSPIGRIRLIAKNGKLTQVLLLGDPAWKESPGARIDNPKSVPAISAATDFLKRYFAGEKVSWVGKSIPAGTEFQNKVWRATAAIPFGVTVSYGELAARIGRSGAARAVGMGMKRNPLPILVPCHRVIGADGGLCGYGGKKPAGLKLKRRLLRHEGVEI
jgi:methylated-DNA-[protein]-cysteine S-methyltransferase